MFRLNKTYPVANGGSARIICVDSNMKHGGKTPCPIVAEITLKASTYTSAIWHFDAEGCYCGIKSVEYKSYRLVSDEPTAEEAELIADIRSLIERSSADDYQLTKAIRKLRAK